MPKEQLKNIAQSNMKILDHINIDLLSFIDGGLPYER